MEEPARDPDQQAASTVRSCTWSLVSGQHKSVSREAHRELLVGLHIQHGDAPILPVSMGTFGGDGLIQCTAEFGGQLTGLRATIEQLDHEA
jgi:hypothetical protein